MEGGDCAGMEGREGRFVLWISFADVRLRRREGEKSALIAIYPGLSYILQHEGEVLCVD